MLCDILPLRVLPPIIYSAMVYWHAGLHDDPYNFFIFVAIVTLVRRLLCWLFLLSACSLVLSLMCRLCVSACCMRGR